MKPKHPINKNEYGGLILFLSLENELHTYKLSKSLGCGLDTALTNLRRLERMGVLKKRIVLTGKRKTHLYSFDFEGPYMLGGINNIPGIDNKRAEKFYKTKFFQDKLKIFLYEDWGVLLAESKRGYEAEDLSSFVKQARVSINNFARVEGFLPWKARELFTSIVYVGIGAMFKKPALFDLMTKDERKLFEDIVNNIQKQVFT